MHSKGRKEKKEERQDSCRKGAPNSDPGAGKNRDDPGANLVEQTSERHRKWNTKWDTEVIDLEGQPLPDSWRCSRGHRGEDGGVEMPGTPEWHEPPECPSGPVDTGEMWLRRFRSIDERIKSMLFLPSLFIFGGAFPPRHVQRKNQDVKTSASQKTSQKRQLKTFKRCCAGS